MMTHALTSVHLQSQWSAKRYRRLLMLATITPFLVAWVFYRFDLQRWSWPISAIAGIGLAYFVLAHAKTAKDAHRRLWTVLAALPIAFWGLAMILTVGDWFA